jgi:hypothetical protein
MSQTRGLDEGSRAKVMSIGFFNLEVFLFFLISPLM